VDAIAAFDKHLPGNPRAPERKEALSFYCLKAGTGVHAKSDESLPKPSAGEGTLIGREACYHIFATFTQPKQAMMAFHILLSELPL